MKLDKILVFINFIANKRQRGSQIVPEQFNALLDAYNSELFNEEWETVQLKAKAAGATVYDIVMNASPLHLFKKEYVFPSTSASGEVAFPSDLEFMFPSVKAKYNGSIRGIDEVSNEEMTALLGGMVGSVLEINPKLVRMANGIKVYPYNVGRDPDFITMTYLRRPATPYYDYCADNTKGISVYMPVGSQIRYSDADVPCLYLDDVLLADNVSHISYTPGGVPYDSVSVEIEWPERVQSKIIGRIMLAMGITMGSKELVDYGNMEAAK